MTKFFRLPTLIIWLTTLWVALWNDLTLGNVVSGVLVATAVVAVARPTGVTGLERTYFRPVSALVFVVYFVVQLVKASLVVAWEIVTPGLRINRAIIAVPMHTSSAGVVTAVANAVTLTPGTVTIEVVENEVALNDGPHPGAGSRVDRTLFIHVLHFIDVDSVRREVLRLERRAIKAFGSRSELPLVDEDLAALGSARHRSAKHPTTTTGKKESAS
jgi:multicomponent Na+:H+ antiporter subunit E